MSIKKTYFLFYLLIGLIGSSLDLCAQQSPSEELINARKGLDYSGDVNDQKNEGEIVDGSGQNPDEKVVEARDGIDYSDDVVKDRKKKRESNSNSFPNINLPNIFGVFLIILLICVLMAILYFVLGNENLLSPKSRKIKDLDLQAVEQIEEDLENQDVAYYLKQAIDKKQFRIAIRLHYLLIIKELSEKKFIHWKRDKTNRDYILETSSRSFAEKFRNSTSIFEKVWYGERQVGETDFNMISEQLDELDSQIKMQTT